MRSRSLFKKVLALTILFSVLNTCFAPSISFALTSGPENPDATSFEPVDSTDMVNLLTGDLAYTIPLIEVPGPEGGYPLALSYHAGIMPDEEASWTGLGWSLNPGAITRNVNGFPDDFDGQENTVRDYWDGGHTNTTSVGVNVGLTGILSADLGVSVSHDTFQGTGIGYYGGLTAGYTLTDGLGASASIGFSVDPFGNTSLTGSAGAGVALAKSGNTSLNAGASIGFSANSNGLNVGAGAGLSASISRAGSNKAFNSMSQSLLGMSMSSGGGGASVSVGGGYSSVENVTFGKIQTSSRGWGITIPVFYGVSLSLKHNYTRYWSDETNTVSTFGTLHYPVTREEMHYAGANYDTYYLADINDQNYSLINASKNDPAKSTGGTLPDYDLYSVLGQGISGYIRPYGYQMEIVGKGKYFTDYTTNRQQQDSHEEIHCDFDWTTGQDVNCQTVLIQNTYTKNPAKLNFRFTNDFANRYVQQNIPLTSGSAMNFDTNPLYGNNDGTYGFDAATERLAGSRNIEYYTNQNIISGSAKVQGFINTKAQGFVRTQNPDGSATSTNDQRIGGFMITNESGVTYHYGLPTYSYEEYTKTSKVGGVNQFNVQKHDNPYATGWLLTAVTGADYVDINNNGFADQGDWGYWVSFEYGRWTNNYAWRTPGIGSKSDLDQNFTFQSQGKKELYYLDAVVTPTHTAIFEKEIRADGKGMVNNDNANPYDGLATAQLRLNNIILLKNSSLENGVAGIRTASATYNLNRPQHNGSNVIDKYDLLQNGLQTTTIRKINFNYDYSLCPGTPNSFDESGSMYNTANSNTSSLPRLGKLTLNNLSFLGKGAEASIPPTHFEYEIPEDLVSQENVIYMGKKDNSDIYKFRINNVLPPFPKSFAEGDIIKLSANNTIYYGLIKQVTDVAADLGSVRRDMELKFLKDQPPLTSNSSYFWKATKNPPYLSESYDMWGLLKADFQKIPGNENLSRLPSKASAKSVDAWSLRRIQHPLGMTTDIVYESDVYSRVALYQNAAIQVSAVDSYAAPVFKVSSTNTFGIDLRDFIRPGDKVQLTLSGDYHTSEIDPQYGGIVDVNNGVSVTSGTEPSLLVIEVHEDYILINDPAFYQILFQNPNGTVFFGGNMSAGGIGNNFGGGIRIKQVINNEPITGVRMAINYDYNRPDFQLLSSGTTSYEPLGLDVVNLRSGGNTNAFQDDISKGFSKLLGLVREVPAPGVMYEYVTVSSQRTAEGQTVQQLGKSQYQFEIFKEGMVGLFNPNPIKSGNTELATILLQNYTSRVGQLKRAIQYDNTGNKLNETVNNYLYDEQTGESAKANASQYETLMGRFNKQGLITERTAEARNNDGKSRYVMTMRSTYPSIMTGTTTIDYKNGVRSSSQTLAYDFYSGAAVKVLTSDSYGNRFVAQTTPAYRIYPEMGLKLHNGKNANMLSQSAESTVFAVDANYNPTGVVSSSATVWSNQLNMLNNTEQVVNTSSVSPGQPNIWRIAKTYQWAPRDRSGGLTSLSEYISYFGNGGSNLSGWLNVSEVSLYNKYSNALEVKDVAGNYAATKMGYQHSKIVATASPANYAEMNFTGFEEDETIAAGVLVRGIVFGPGNITTNTGHTGDRSATLVSGQSGLSYSINTSSLTPGRTYTASVWLKSTGDPLSSGLFFRINGGSATNAFASAGKKAGDWYLVNLQIPASSIPAAGTLEVGCTNTNSGITFFDDFRFKPVNATMASYVYDKFSGELTYTLDNSNLFTGYQYDSEGRLIKISRETFAYGVKPVGEYVYNYAKSSAAKWQLTGNTRCQQINAVNTGMRESEQVDVNTVSISYNQTRWVVTGSSSQCIVP